MKRGFTLLEVMIVALIVGLVLVISVPPIVVSCSNSSAKVREDPDYALFKAWQHMEQNYVITFHDWKLLKDAGLLERKRRE